LVGLVAKFVILISSRLNISTIFFLVMKIGTPYTIDLIIFGLKRVMAQINSFTNSWIKFNYTLSKPKMPMCLTHSTSLPTIHHSNLSISKKKILPILKKVTTIFFPPHDLFPMQAGFHPVLILNSPSSFILLMPSPCWCFLSSSPTRNWCNFLQHNNTIKR
jgi:hypothetical protein